MRLLLDTHVWLWSAGEPARLSEEARALLEDPEHELWLSAASVWETRTLAERRRIRVDAPIDEWIERQLTEVPVRDAAITRRIAVVAGRVDIPTRDPVDRFLAATAIVESLNLLTADAALLGSRQFESTRAA